MKSIIFYLSSLLLLLNAATIQQSCAQTPFWKLNICEIDCQKCGAKGSCSECPDGFNLTKNKCVQDNNKILRFSFFTAEQQTSKSINQFLFKKSNQLLVINDTVRICNPGSYKFDMMGLFNQQDRLVFNMNFDNPVTALTFRFNFFTILKNTKVQLIMNGNQVYQTTISGSDLKVDYQRHNESSTNQSYLSVLSLTQTSSSVLIRKFGTGQIAFDYDQFKNNVLFQIQVSLVNNPQSKEQFWGFSDFSVVAKKCSDCLPQRLKTLSANVGIAIGINAGALAFLILILFACVKFQQNKRRKALQENETSYNLEKSEEKLEHKQQDKDQRLRVRETVPKVVGKLEEKKTKNT